jgi:hypothetical protein
VHSTASEYAVAADALTSTWRHLAGPEAGREPGSARSLVSVSDGVVYLVCRHLHRQPDAVTLEPLELSLQASH